MQTKPLTAHQVHRFESPSPLRARRMDRVFYDWSDARVEKLKSMWKEGLSASQISTRIDGKPSRNAVIGKVHRLGLAGRKLTVTKKRQKPEPRIAHDRRYQPIAFRRPLMEPVFTQLPAADDIARVQLVDLEPNHCRWPVGEPTKGFCGCDKVPGLSYCAGHAARAYRVFAVVSSVVVAVREREAA